MVNEKLRLLFFGLYGQFSLIPLQTLLQAGFRPMSVVLPAGDNAAAPIVQLCQAADVRLLFVNRVGEQTAVSHFRALAPDLAIVSCFSQKIPQAVLDIPRLGFLNLHPSRLPQHRGPDPLFWTFRSGKLETAVTLHQMDTGLDTGDIVRQQAIRLPEGISGAAAEEACARLGGEMLVELVDELTAAPNLATATELPLPTTPQDSLGSSEPFPTPFDFGLDLQWAARRAFIFMRGTAGWGYPYRLEAGGQVWWLKTAVSYQPAADSWPLGTVKRQEETHVIQFAAGRLTAVLVNV